MIVKIIARSIGSNPSSNGQLMKTDSDNASLRFATRPPGLAQFVADSLGKGRALASHQRLDLDAAIAHSARGSLCGTPSTQLSFDLGSHSGLPLRAKCRDARQNLDNKDWEDNRAQPPNVLQF